MAALNEIPPPAKSSAATFDDHSTNPWFNQRSSAPTEDVKADIIITNPALSYNTLERLKDASSGTKTLPVTVDECGKLTFDDIVKQYENAKNIVYSQRRYLIPKDLKFIKYKPTQQSAAFNSGANERMIRMVGMVVDPLELPKFKHKRVPKVNGSPPVPVMQSPPRPVTVKDQQDWKIPPCVSNWKNSKGYTVPLDKRLAADGRGLQEVKINENFAKLSEALYVSEQQAREAVSMRSKVQMEMAMKEKERKEQELRVLAQKARSERTGTGPTVGAGLGLFASDASMMDTDEPTRPEYEHRNRRGNDRDQNPSKETKVEREERVQREKIREERRRERERERRLEAKDAAMGKRSKITRDHDRDISEKVALGMASAGSTRGGEVMYDQRLFNQEKGMDFGFATDDQYNVYDKGLFTGQPTLSTLYRPNKGFTGAEDADPFGLNQFLTQVNGGKKPADIMGSGEKGH